MRLQNFNRADKDPRSIAFMRDLRLLYLKYGLCLAPTYQGEISYHDSMELIPYDEAAEEFLRRTGIQETPGEDFSSAQ